MRFISLQSGSNGNCLYVEANGMRLLLDAGISGRKARQRLAQHGRYIEAVDALLISHDHGDHVRCMGIFQRQFGTPIFVTEKTLNAARENNALGKFGDVRTFTAGETIDLGSVTVETIPTPHDSADGVAFVVDDGRSRLGILTDLGHVFDELHTVMDSLDAVLIESNYDPVMLADGPYPEFLKKRIRGPGGHLSNVESAKLLHTSAGQRLKWVCIGHLSQQNNQPQLAIKAHYDLLGARFPLYVASRYEPTDVLEV